MQNHVHDGDDIGQRLLFLAEERALLKRLSVLCGEALFGFQVDERLAEELDLEANKW
jgi:hypothetical protein